MPKKKTNYENKGFVRQLAGSIFSNEKGTGKFRGKNETKWRPRKNLFERLDAKDGFEISNTYSFSVESDTGEYKREIMSGQKYVLQTGDAIKVHADNANIDVILSFMEIT